MVPRKHVPKVRSQKRTPKPKNRKNSTKDFSEQFEGITGHYPLKRGFEANRTREFTRKFGEIFVAKILWGTFSVPDKEPKVPKSA